VWQTGFWQYSCGPRTKCEGKNKVFFFLSLNNR